MSIPVLIKFVAFGQQFAYAGLDELLAAADGLKAEATLEWSQRTKAGANLAEIATSVRLRLSVMAAHLDIANQIIEAEDQKLEQDCAEIDKLLGDL